MPAYGSVDEAGNQLPPGWLSDRGHARRHHLALVAAACLCIAVAVSTHVFALSSRALDSSVVAEQRPQMLWGGSGGVTDALVSAAAAARGSIRGSQKLADYNPDTLYKDPAATDWDHENRIDKYGCLFSDCEGSKKPLLQTVGRLQRLLNKLSAAQDKFIKDLKDKPVETTMKVTVGEPGRLGKRGDRGPLGRRGPKGITGPKGRAGFMGRPGLPGDEGPRGDQGRTGPTGARGRQGVKGERGLVGPRGPKGRTGPRGGPGPRGYAGDNGPAGQDGQKGGKGKPGSAPAGPPGPPGLVGPRGPKGDKGAKGNRGPEGAPGQPGPAGIPGIQGLKGPYGKDAKQLPVPVCEGQTSTRGKTICHGFASVDWRDYYTAGVYLTVDTKGCKFTSDDVLYFTSLTGNAHLQLTTGGSAIYSVKKNSFQVYVSSDYILSHVRGWEFNRARIRVSWVGVGVSSGPKTTAVCCGSGSNEWGSWNVEGSQEIDAGACKMKGSPVWILGAEGGKSFGSSQFLGTNAAYNVGERYATMKIRKSTGSDWINGNVLKQNNLVPRYCLFGEPFPSGDQLVTEHEINQDEYPCDGMRVVKPSTGVQHAGEDCWGGCNAKQGPCGWCGTGMCCRNGWGDKSNGCDGRLGIPGKGHVCVSRRPEPVTNTAAMCCGKTDTTWTKDSLGQLSKTVDTSECNFKDNNVVYITSIGGNGNQWRATGSTTLTDSNSKQFVLALLLHPTQWEPSNAAAHGWHVNWCGVGNAGKPN